MLGLIRFLLSTFVVFFHITASIPLLGNFSVNFFYVISGFLITLILHETYSFNFYKFWANRFLRLYPAYYFFLAIGIIITLYLPNAVRFHQCWSGVMIKYDLVGNALLFPWSVLSDNSVMDTFGSFISNNPLMVQGQRFRIIPSSWSVAVEITCYFILWASSARNLILCSIFLFLSVIYQFYSIVYLSSFSLIYFPFFAAMLPFSLGSLGYFIYRKIRTKNLFLSITKKPITITIMCLSSFFLNWYIGINNSSNGINHITYYMNNIIALLSVILLVNARVRGKCGRIFSFLGDLSYPMFLCQYLAGYFAWAILNYPETTRGWSLLAISYPITIIMACISVLLIDRKISSIRDKIRKF